MARTLLHLLLLCTLLQPLSAQTPARNDGVAPPPPPPPTSSTGPVTAQQDIEDVLVVTTDLVTVPFSVMDRNDRYMTGLRREETHLYEDGVEQEIAFFNDIDQPIFVVLLIDTSGSTATKLKDMKEAAIAFVNQLRPGDRVLPISFDSRIHMTLRQPTGDRDILTEAILKMSTATGLDNGTGLYDAVDFVTKRIFRPSGRQAMILLTDGGDTGSTATQKGSLSVATELNALIYSVYYNPQDIGPKAITSWTVPDKIYIRYLAEKTGGRFYEPKEAEKLDQAFAAVAEELRRQYSVSYYPKDKVQSKRRRKIQVKVTLPGAKIRSRDSYIYRPPVKK